MRAGRVCTRRAEDVVADERLPALRVVRDLLAELAVRPRAGRDIAADAAADVRPAAAEEGSHVARPDRKSTRLNSSHANISYAVFCLKKKNYILNKLH